MIIKYKKTVHRMSRILEMLIVHSGSLSIRDIAMENRCSERTVYNDINYLVEKYNSLLQLDLSHNMLVSQNTSVGNIQYITEEIFAQQHITKLLQLIFEKPNQTVDFYADSLRMSQQATRNSLIDLRSSLEEFGLGLILRTRKIRIVGDEYMIRYFFATFFYQFTHLYCPETPMIFYDEQITDYLQEYSIISSFMKHLISVSTIRYRCGFPMHSTIGSLDDDVNSLLSEFIRVLEVNREQLKPIETKLFDILNQMGYTIPKSDHTKILTLIASIIYMETTIHSINNTRVHVVNLFARNYSMVHPRRFKQAKEALYDLLSEFTTNTDQIIAGIIYIIAVHYPVSHKNQEQSFMVYSDVGYENSRALKRQLDMYFPNHRFHVYNATSAYQFPSRHDVVDFCKTKSCAGIISTMSFPYKPEQPILTVSDYFVGSDIGQIFDFINAQDA